MNLSENHQKIFDEAYPDGYSVKDIEKDYFHIMYVRIVKDGERTRDVPSVQMYSKEDWRKTKTIFDKHAIKAVTGFSEYGVIHDPTAKAREAKAKPEEAKVKPEVKPKGRPPQKESQK